MTYDEFWDLVDDEEVCPTIVSAMLLAGDGQDLDKDKFIYNLSYDLDGVVDLEDGDLEDMANYTAKVYKKFCKIDDPVLDSMIKDFFEEEDGSFNNYHTYEVQQVCSAFYNAVDEVSSLY